MRIFYQYSNVSPHELKPVKGDFINEINFVKTLNEFATVQYGGNPRPSDIYYIRANAKLFLKLPHPKIWFASPFDRVCYKQADLITTFSEPWAEGIRNGNNFNWINPQDKNPYSKAVSISQPVGEHFMPLKSHALTRKIRREIGGNGKFVIGHFGKVTEVTYPSAFLKILPLLEKRGVIYFNASASRQKNFLPGRKWSFAYSQMPYAISACDLIIISTQVANGGWELSGCQKILEAAACGIPLICGNSASRREFLGDHYPLLHSGFNKDETVGAKWDSDQFYKPESKKKDAEELLELINLVIENADLRIKIGQDLIVRANKRKPKQLANKLKPIFDGIKQKRTTGILLQ